jgi:uncharacterized protein
LLLQPFEKSAIVRAMTRRSIIAAAVVFAVILPFAARCAGDVDQASVDQLYSAIRDGNFSAATSNFNPVMKAALSANKLQAAWQQTFGREGPLRSWKIVDRTPVLGGDEIAVELDFDHSTAMSTVAVASASGEIGSLFFKLPKSNAPAVSPPYADASKFHSEQVTLGDSPDKLPGTLTIPNGTGPFPAVVLVHGSGPQDRDESIGANRPFKDIAEGLSSRGIIVLRYDKRTLLHTLASVTVDDEVIVDAVAAVNQLRARPDIDRNRIFVLGHSLGAVLAPEIASKAKPVAGIIMLAPSGRKIEQIIVQQVRYLHEASPEQLDQIEHQANEISHHTMPPTETWLGAPASCYYDLDNRDEVAIARTLGVPILILHGARDYQVIDQDIDVWQKGLKGVARVKFEELPKLNHLFIAGEGTPGPDEYNTLGHVDIAVIEAITSFINSR